MGFKRLRRPHHVATHKNIYTETARLFSTEVTPGALHAELRASLRSSQVCTEPASVTRPPSVDTRILSASSSALRQSAFSTRSLMPPGAVPGLSVMLLLT